MEANKEKRQQKMLDKRLSEKEAKIVLKNIWAAQKERERNTPSLWKFSKNGFTLP